MRLLALLLTCALVPQAAALELRADEPGGLDLQPLATHDGTLQVTIRCMGTDDQLASTEEWTLVHEVHHDVPGLSVSPAAETSLPSELCQTQDSADVELAFDLLGDHTVPGERTMHLEHTLTVRTPTQVLGETKVGQQAIMAWTGDFTVLREVHSATAGPQREILYPITITNHGNARAVYVFEVVQAPELGQLVLPPQVVLDSVATGDETTQTVHVRYATPFENGDNEANETFSIRVHSESTRNPEFKGDAQVLEFNAVTDGVYVPAPGMLVPAGLLAAALLRRRS